MRRVGRLLLAVLSAIAVLGISLLAAQALLGTDPGPAEGEGAQAPAPIANRAVATEHPGEVSQGTRPADIASPKRRTLLLAAGAHASWMELERALPARLGLTLVPLGGKGARTFGSLRSGHAWSTIKVPILVTLLRERSGTLSPTEKAWAHSALTASDNEAAAALFGEIEDARGGLAQASRAIEETLRLASDTTTVVSTEPPPPGSLSTYGQTEWSLSASARFFRALARGCLLEPVATRYVLDLMEGVVADQRWGLGELRLDSTRRVAFKGGWGPEGNASGPYLVRQSGVLRNGKTGLAVAIAAQADTGSFEAGIEALNRIAAWLHDNLRGLGPSVKASC